MVPSKSTSSTTSRRSNRDDIANTLKNIDPHKLDILEHRIRGNQEGGIESHSFTPPRSIISPAITSGGGYTRRSRSGSVSNLTTATSDGEGNKVGGLLSGDDKSNLNAVTFEQEHAAASNASCQTVHHANSTKKRKQQDSKPSAAAGSGKKEAKKKSTPSKRKVSAIGQLTAANNNGNVSKSKKKGKTETAKATANGKSSGGQKKRRVKKTAGEDTSSKSASMALETGNSRSANSRSGAPSSKSHKQSSSANNSTSAAAAAASTTGTEESRDTLYSYFGNASNPAAGLASTSNHSRSCSSPPALQSKKEKTGNQRTLHSFLGISSKKKQQQQDVGEDDGDKKLGEKVATKDETSGKKDESSTSQKPATKKKRASLKSTTPISDTTATTNSDQSTEIKQLHNHLSTLQKQLQDAKARNDSIKNNQTLLSTNLQRQLKNQKVELEKVRNDSDTKMTKAMEVMEKLVRDESIRESNELRQKLASDGARLGRLVSSRISSGNGMRSQIIESWEDGSAPSAVKMKREELRIKRDELERRKDELRRGVYLPQESTTDNNDNGDDSEDDTLDGNDDSLTESRESTNNESNGPNDNANVDSSEFMMNDLDRLEAHETVRVRLDEVRKEEAELDRQERALNIEKRGHLRSLKLVANEDSSKWRNERKLHERYVLMNLLGKGGFSEVWRAFDLEDMRNVAVKIHQVESSWSDSKKENYTKHVAREFEIHQVVRHPRIVSLFDVFEIDDDTFATVLECCKGTDLDTILKDRGRLPERDARAILMQILSGMRYLSTPSADGERQGIIHYDLKPGNILFDEKGNAKITDFGLSKIVDDNEDGDSMELTSQGAGTYWYLPPECFLTEQDVRISNKVDVWSIGVIYYQMLYGRRPFGDGQSQDHILRHQTMLQATEVNFPSKPSITEKGKAFIRHCLTYEQIDRPTVGEVCEHEYLKLTSL